jgi:hypothetical protein
MIRSDAVTSSSKPRHTDNPADRPGCLFRELDHGQDAMVLISRPTMSRTVSSGG